MSLDMSKLRSGIEKEKGKNEILLTASFYISDASDLVNYELAYGTDVTSDFSAYMQTDEYQTIKIKKVQTVEVFFGQRVPARVIMIASTNLSRGGAFSPTTSLGDKVIPDYFFGEVYIDPDWLGVRRANSTDEDALKGSFYTGEECRVGDWIFKNAEAGTEGTKNTDESDVIFTTISNDTIKENVGKKILTRCYNVEYYTTKSMSKIQLLEGVNLSNGFPTKYKPPDLTTYKLWLSKGERITTVTDRNGKQWTKVVRKFMKAPKIDKIQYYWNHKKCNGTFDWT